MVLFKYTLFSLIPVHRNAVPHILALLSFCSSNNCQQTRRLSVFAAIIFFELLNASCATHVHLNVPRTTTKEPWNLFHFRAEAADLSSWNDQVSPKPLSRTRSYDRFTFSSKASSPQSAIQCVLFQFTVSSRFLKVTQQLLTYSSLSLLYFPLSFLP